MQECFLQEYLSDTIASEAALFVPYNFPYRTFSRLEAYKES